MARLTGHRDGGTAGPPPPPAMRRCGSGAAGIPPKLRNDKRPGRLVEVERPHWKPAASGTTADLATGKPNLAAGLVINILFRRCGRVRRCERSCGASGSTPPWRSTDRLGLHDYHTVIECPMDLGRTVHTFAGDLLASFEKMYKASVSWFEQELKLLEPPIPVQPPATAPAQVKPRAGNVKMQKPKAREPNKREMTLEEKNLLRVGLESLPEEKMHNVLQITRKRNGNPELVGGEIELYIDEMDVETQWELDRFVNNFKKALNKSRRAAIVNDKHPFPAMRKGATLRKVMRSIWFNAPVEVDRPPRAPRLPHRHRVPHGSRQDGEGEHRRQKVHTFAGDLLASFEKMYKASVSWFEQELKLLEPPIPVQPPATAPAQVKPRAGNVKMQKPKAREPNKREMTLEEKNLLRVGLESLPEEKMHNVLQITRKRNGNPELVGGEIELYIDEMDVETQWELDRFVNNFKKALNKSRRAAIVNGENADVIDASVANDSDMLVNGSTATMVDNGDVTMAIESKDPDKITAQAEQLDEYVDIGDEMPTATYQSLEIEKDTEVASSGSSSSSDSGSSKDSVSESGNAHSLV
uniref:NET domain-containing protein n=1 Tax=Oryza nivara TaxID=4536 RepID=A0A0E0H656_ORYNI